jgi:hypothetical protein
MGKARMEGTEGFQSCNRRAHVHESDRALQDGYFLGGAVPGTSCQARHEQAIARRMATIAESLRDVSEQALVRDPNIEMIFNI